MHKTVSSTQRMNSKKELWNDSLESLGMDRSGRTISGLERYIETLYTIKKLCEKEDLGTIFGKELKIL